MRLYTDMAFCLKDGEVIVLKLPEIGTVTTRVAIELINTMFHIYSRELTPSIINIRLLKGVGKFNISKGVKLLELIRHEPEPITIDSDVREVTSRRLEQAVGEQPGIEKLQSKAVR